eukprot:TRINITY_DN5388_c0_g1_i13.p1 TRINITY_DN5388_c0_g1~~TRINITY_DN5388_c0_g1_i13.p1  ORF type:complete len:335 (-),score=72.12 TRINITY_DN5388_c0_g1_i13:69-1073(-)
MNFDLFDNNEANQQQLNDTTNQDSSEGLGTSFWKVGSLLKKGAQGFVQAVQETDWQKEFKSLTQGVDNEGTGQQEHEEKKGIQVKDKLDKLTAIGQSVFQSTKAAWNSVAETVEQDIQQAQSEAKRANRPVVKPSGEKKVEKKLNKLDLEISSMQRKSSTYIDEPSDLDAFQKFSESFNLGEKQKEISDLLANNSFMAALHQRIVPVVVDDYTFWVRYFYHLDSLRQRHTINYEEQDTDKGDGQQGIQEADTRTTSGQYDVVSTSQEQNNNEGCQQNEVPEDCTQDELTDFEKVDLATNSSSTKDDLEENKVVEEQWQVVKEDSPSSKEELTKE